MSIKLMRAIWDGRESLGLSGIDAAILVKLADFAQDDGSSVYPSLEHVANKTGFSRSTIKRSIKLLCAKNILVNVSGGKTLTNLYRIDAHKVYSSSSNIVDDGFTVTPNQVHCEPPLGQTEPPQSVSNIVDTRVRLNPPGVTVTHNQGQTEPQSVIEPLIEPLLSYPKTKNFNDPEVQGVSVSKNDSEKNHEEVVNNFAETLGNISQIDLEAGIQNTPPGGVDPVIEKKPSKVFLKEGFDSDPFHDPSGGSSKSDHVPEDLLDEDPGYEESGYDYSLEERDLEEGDRNELSNGLEADRIKASRGDSMHAQAPLKQPSEKNTPKTCHFSVSEGLPLQDIKDDQETSVACLKTPTIDMSDGGGEGESKKGVSRKQQKKENRGTRIDETMVLDKNKLDIALNQGFHGSWAVSEFEEFVRYYANPNLASSKALHVNWEATWRNWCKNAIVYDRYEKKSKPHPTNTTPSFESSAASLPSPAVDSRLQDFVKKNPQVGANSNGWAFSACKVIDQGDTILIIAPTNLSCDKVGMYGQALSAYFGKRVEITMNTPPRPLIPQNNERKYVAVDYVVQENHPKETAPNSLLQDIEVPSRVDNFPYKSIGVVLQEAMQGGMR